jgi:hypothetical protein
MYQFSQLISTHATPTHPVHRAKRGAGIRHQVASAILSVAEGRTARLALVE